mgnify:CR=1 FL=1
MSEITCFDPQCRQPASNKAHDEKFGQFVAFCDDCVGNWRDVDHIDFEPYTEVAEL